MNALFVHKYMTLVGLVYGETKREGGGVGESVIHGSVKHLFNIIVVQFSANENVLRIFHPPPQLPAIYRIAGTHRPNFHISMAEMHGGEGGLRQNVVRVCQLMHMLFGQCVQPRIRHDICMCVCVYVIRVAYNSE